MYLERNSRFLLALTGIVMVCCLPAAADPGEGCCPGSPYGNSSTDRVYSVNTSLNGNLECHDLTVNPGVTLDTRGYIVRVCGTLLNSGTITDTRCGGALGTGGTGGDGQDPCENSGGPPWPEDAECGTPGSNPTCSGGGHGGDGGGGGGGGGGARCVAPCVDADGGNGGDGGDGGRGGGRVYIYAYRFDNRGLIHADAQNGSAGGNGTNGEYFSWGIVPKDMCGGGGGGGAGGNGGDGGTVAIYYGHLLNEGTIRANGGLGGAGGNGGLSGCHREGHCLYWGAPCSEYNGGNGCPDLPAHPRGGDGGWGERHQDLCGENGYPGDRGLDGAPGQWSLNADDPNPCLLGACCYPDVSCLDVPQPDCGGIWMGLGSDCDTVSCPLPAWCRGNSNCDGVVDWHDIDYFVAAMNNNYLAWCAMFLPDPPPQTYWNNDVNADGTVNWCDIDAFVAVMNTVCP